MRSLLYHGTPNIEAILQSGSLLPCSYPEYDFEVPHSVLSLTRCHRFAKSYTAERDPPHHPAIIHFDRDLLRHTHRLWIARSMIWDEINGYRDRSECEEFVIKPIPMTHPAIIYIERL